MIKITFHEKTRNFSRDINFSWNFSRDTQYVIQSRFIYHVIRAFISRNTEPDVCIRGFSFIFEMDTKDMAASVSILYTNLISLMLGMKVRVELIARVSYSIHLVVIAGPKCAPKYTFGMMTALVVLNIVNEQIYQWEILWTLAMDYLIFSLCHNMFILKFVCFSIYIHPPFSTTVMRR